MQFKSAEQRIAMRTMMEQSQMVFTRFMFRQREDQRMTVNWHHLVIARALDAVLNGEIPRLLINLPPGYTKTMFLLDLMARGFTRNPMARNIHLTYNSQLAVNNSQILLDTLELPEFKSMWNVRLRQDSSAKRRWNTKHGGGLVASGIGGTVTGFRAGRITPGRFSGCMTIDDPIKPDDAFSRKTRDMVNAKMNNTIRSRLMLPTTPIIMTMQRLHDNDPSGFVLRGGTGDEWTHLELPAKMEKHHLKPGKKYAKQYPYGKPLIYSDLFQKGWTWPLRCDEREHAIIKKGDPIVCAAQYDQAPMLMEGKFIKGKWLHYYKELPHLKGFRRVLATVDTALEAKTHNDRTVWMVWGEHSDGHTYLLDYFGDQLEVPDIETSLERVWLRFRNSAATGLPRIQAMHVEKKASGHGIIQKCNRNGMHMIPVERNTDKVTRAVQSIPALKTGTLLFPARNVKTDFTRNRQFDLMIGEVLRFSADMDHANDDFCDTIFDACDLFYTGLSQFRQTFGQSAAA